MFDAVLLSDIHLGSDNCQAKRICELLERIADGDLATARLILNGDVFDSIDFRRLKKSHWKILSLIRKLSDQIEILWLCGNHDGSAEIVSHLLGVAVRDDVVLESGGRRILILHGHVFDEFIDNHPVLTWLADSVYGLLQWIDRTHYFAKLAKRGSKTFLRCAMKIEERSIEAAHGATAPRSAAATPTLRRPVRKPPWLITTAVAGRNCPARISPSAPAWYSCMNSGQVRWFSTGRKRLPIDCNPGRTVETAQTVFSLQCAGIAQRTVLFCRKDGKMAYPYCPNCR